MVQYDIVYAGVFKWRREYGEKCKPIGGCYFTLRDGSVWTALMYSSENVKPECSAHLYRAGTDMRVGDTKDMTALMLASLYSHFMWVQIFLSLL